MKKILHFSDLHFHTKDADNLVLHEFLTKIRIDYSDHIHVVTGDITDDGSQEQYHQVIKHLKMPFRDLILCPGNHDYGAVGLAYSEKCAQRFDTFLSYRGEGFRYKEPVVTIVENLMFIALNSNAQTQHIFDFACGQLGHKQIERLDMILNTEKHKKKVVILHHHPFERDPFQKLLDAEEFWRCIFNRVDVLLFGHKHKHKIWRNVNGVDLIVGSGAPTMVTEIKFNVPGHGIKAEGVWL